MEQEEIDDQKMMEQLDMPVVVPWNLKPQCPKCLKIHGVNSWLLKLLYPFRRYTFIEICYCAGGHEPEIKVQSLFGSQKLEVTCFGLHEEHFHASCKTCNFNYIMACAQQKETK